MFQICGILHEVILDSNTVDIMKTNSLHGIDDGIINLDGVYKAMQLPELLRLWILIPILLLGLLVASL